MYLSLAGIGFYYLGREFGWNKYTALLVAVAYEFSGPLVDSMQFTTIISSAAYIPFVFLYFRRLLHHRQPLSNSLRCSLCLFLLFTGGYPAIIIITFYLLVAFFLFSFFTAPEKTPFLQRIWLPATVMIAVFFLLALPAIVSFLAHLPFIDRGKHQQLAFVLENSMPPACMFSLVSPFSTTAAASIFNTDPLMRNVYIGIIPLLFFVYACLNKTLLAKRQIRFFLITAFVLFGMAWGSHFFLRQLAYYVLPLMDTFRHPALFRLFGVIFLLLIAGTGLNEWYEKGLHSRLLKRIILVFAVATCLVAVAAVVFEAPDFPPVLSGLAPLKNLLSQLGFGQRLLLQLPLIFITTSIFLWIAYRAKRVSFLLALCVADLFFATQVNMPVTVIGATRFGEMVRLLDRNPILFPLPGNSSIEQNSLQSLDSSKTIGSTLTYRKRIGRNDYFITPGNLSLQDQFYESGIKAPVFKNRLLYFADTIVQQVAPADTNKLASRPFAIVPGNAGPVNGAAHPGDTIAIASLSANSLAADVQTAEPRLLVFLQNNYPGWKAYIDGRETAVMKTNISFMALTVPPGKHRVLFRYLPTQVLIAWYMSLLTMLCMGSLFIGGLTYRRIFPHHHNQ